MLQFSNECVMMYLNTDWRPGVKHVFDWRIVSCDLAYYTAVTVCEVTKQPIPHSHVKHAIFYIDMLSLIHPVLGCKGTEKLLYQRVSEPRLVIVERNRFVS